MGKITLTADNGLGGDNNEGREAREEAVSVSQM